MWIAVANQNLSPLGLTQRDTGYIQAAIVTIAVVMNISNSFLSDMFAGNLKTFICTFLTISLAAALWLALICFKVVAISSTTISTIAILTISTTLQAAPFSLVSVYTSAIVCMVALRCIIALFYELLMEVGRVGAVHPLQVHYPVPEHLTSLVWGQAGRLLSATFLGMFRCVTSHIFTTKGLFIYYVIT